MTKKILGLLFAFALVTSNQSSAAEFSAKAVRTLDAIEKPLRARSISLRKQENERLQGQQQTYQDLIPPKEFEAVKKNSDNYRLIGKNRGFARELNKKIEELRQDPAEAEQVKLLEEYFVKRFGNSDYSLVEDSFWDAANMARNTYENSKTHLEDLMQRELPWVQRRQQMRSYEERPQG